MFTSIPGISVELSHKQRYMYNGHYQKCVLKLVAKINEWKLIELSTGLVKFVKKQAGMKKSVAMSQFI